PRGDAGPGQEADGGEVEGPREPEGPSRAEARRHGTDAVRPVEVDVEERVEDVEASDPAGHGEPEEDGREPEVAWHGEPGAERGEPDGEPEREVAAPGDALGVRVEREGGHRDGPEPPARARELAHSREEGREGDGGEDRHLGGGQASARELTPR